MRVLRALVLPVILLALAACAPAVPYNQMPGGSGDLFSSANGNRMTADALLREAQWQEDALTQTSQAPIVRITETAAALAVQATQAQSTSVAAAQTQAGAMTATAIWWTPTPVPTATPNLTATLDAIAIEAAQTQTTLLLEREEQNNEFNRLKGPIALVIAAFIAIWVMMLITRSRRFRPLETDARGNVLPQLDIVEGTVMDSDRNPNFKGSMKNDWLIRILAHIVEQKLGAKILLPEVTAQRQDATTERDQMIDLATRGLPGPTASESKEAKKLAGQQMMKQLSDSNLKSRYRILDDSANSPEIVEGHVLQVLDQDWKEAQKK